MKLWREMTAAEESANASIADSGSNASGGGADGGSGSSTPTRPSTLKTLPSFKDPRSPPNDPTATRTPIQVEATPGKGQAHCDFAFIWPFFKKVFG